MAQAVFYGALYPLCLDLNREPNPTSQPEGDAATAPLLLSISQRVETFRATHPPQHGSAMDAVLALSAAGGHRC